MPRRVRTFVAVDVDRFSHDRLTGLQEKLATVDNAVRWVAPGHFHVTLVFLGDVDERRLADVCRVVGKAAQQFKSFAFTLEGMSAFPTVRRPRTLIVPITEGAQQLLALHAELERVLDEVGVYRPEERPFSPHLTLGRVKRDADVEAVSQAVTRLGPWRGGQTTVNEIRVMSSAMHGDGPEYAVLSRCRLA